MSFFDGLLSHLKLELAFPKIEQLVFIRLAWSKSEMPGWMGGFSRLLKLWLSLAFIRENRGRVLLVCVACRHSGDLCSRTKMSSSRWGSRSVVLPICRSLGRWRFSKLALIWTTSPCIPSLGSGGCLRRPIYTESFRHPIA
jgi:hypothetical protein